MKAMSVAAAMYAAASGAAAAEPAPFLMTSVRIDHGDLDLSSPLGRQALSERVAEAVLAACRARTATSD